MRLSPDLQGYSNIGRVFRVLLEYYEMIEGGARKVEDDIVNHLFLYQWLGDVDNGFRAYQSYRLGIGTA